MLSSMCLHKNHSHAVKITAPHDFKDQIVTSTVVDSCSALKQSIINQVLSFPGINEE